MLLPGLLLAVVAANDLPLLHRTHDRWTRADGLPTNTINALAQSADGFLWLGTEEGLVRFDGVAFRRYDAKSVPELGSDVAWRVFAARDGTLWIGTDRGAASLTDGRFRSHAVSGEGRARDFAETAEGTLLAATPTGVFEFRGGAFVPIPGAERDCTEIDALSDGTIVCVSEGLWAIRGGSATPVLPDVPGVAGSNTVAEAADGSVWVGTRDGTVLRLRSDLALLERFDGVAGGMAQDLHVAPDGAVWVAAIGGGLTRLAQGRADRLRSEALGGTGATACLIDRDGNAWIGGDGGGLHRLSVRPVTSLAAREGLPDAAVTSIHAARDGTIWVGTVSGLFRGDGVRFDAEPTFPRGAPVTAIGEDREGRIWAAPIGSGVWVGDRGRFEPRRLRERPLGLVFSIRTDPNGRLLVAGESGILEVDGDAARPVPFVPPGSDAPAVASILGARDGALWIGTMGGGLFRRTHAGTESIEVPAPIVVDLHESADGAVWIATYGGGLHRWKEGTLTAFREGDGFPTDAVLTILAGDEGTLWLGTNDGVVRLEPDAPGGATTAVLSRRDGLRTGECRGGGTSSASRGPDGRLWFVASEGIAVVDPRREIPVPAPPTPRLESLACDGASIALDGGAIEVPAGARNCEIRYAAPSLSDPEAVRFRYRMEREDRGWVEAGGRRTAYYTGFGPGAHEFRVVAVAADGTASPPASLRFRQVPRWTQTWTFWGLAGVALLATGYAAHRTRLGSLRRQRARLEAVVAERTAELAALNRDLERRVEEGIEKLRANERFAAYGQMVAGVAHEVRHPIFALRTAAYLLAQQPVVAHEAPLRTLREETDRLTRLTDDLLQFAREPVLAVGEHPAGEILEAASSSLRAAHPSAPSVRIATEPGTPVLAVDRDRIVQVLVNLLGNALKHGGDVRRLSLEASRAGDAVAIRVEDDGRGIDPAHLPRIFEPFYSAGGGTGLGLAIAQRLVRAHGGTIEAGSEPGKGTRFTIVLPAGRGR